MLLIAMLLNTIVPLGAGPSQPSFQPGAPMVITAGNDVGWQVLSIEDGQKVFQEAGTLRCEPADRLFPHWESNGARYVEHGVTAFEPYVKWMLMEPEEGVWDPAFYDAELEVFRKHGLKWVPFLIAGPAYATPPWFKDSAESVFAVDLETGDVARDQSIWNPHLRPRVKDWLARFFAHYDHDDMQSVLLGISGVFGESIYTAGGNGWTHIWDGPYPQHFGWWCGDSFAVEDFRRSMEEKYGKIFRLNHAWKTDFASFEDVRPFVPNEKHAQRARLDLIRWYAAAMTDYAEWWIATTRELAPEVPILLCTGGGGNPKLGADLSGQTKMTALYGAGMRITNEASDYAMNFHLTRMIGTASRHYGTYFGYEPAGGVDEDGIIARVYNAVASGAWEFFHYDNPPQGQRGEHYKRTLDLMQIRDPIIEVGFFWSRTSVDLELHQGRDESAMTARDLCDLAYVDERLISDGALDRLKILLWAAGTVTEPETAEAIKRAVKAGMTLIVPAGWAPKSPEGDPLFPAGKTRGKPIENGPVSAMDRVGKGCILQGGTSSVSSAVNALAAAIKEPARYGISPLSPEAAIDGRFDKLYVTVTTNDLLLYNHGEQDLSIETPQGSVDVPGHAIISLRRSEVR